MKQSIEIATLISFVRNDKNIMRVKVKICGIKTLEAAKASIDAGADFLGFNFVPTSKRFIKPEIVKKISSRLCANNIKIVGVFQNEKIDVVNKLINYLKLDYVQLHGDESPQYTEKIKRAGIIKTFSMPADFDIESTIKKMKKYKVDYFLLDREKQGKGELLNLEKVCKLTNLFPIILAGGLTVDNVMDSISSAKPIGVDVASGVEINKKKNSEKIKQFIQMVKDKYSSSDERSEKSRSLIERFSTSSNNKKGYFGKFGGQFVPEFLYPALKELEDIFEKVKQDATFQREFDRLLHDYAGRPTPLYYARKTSEFIGCKVYFKREDLLNGGSHKINNALGQVLMARLMGKKRIVTETAAGMHGVAATMAANVAGLTCDAFMGVKDIERQKLNAEKIKILGGNMIPVIRGNGILKDAVSEAMVAWIRDLPNTHYLIGSAIGPYPYPAIVAYFQKVIGEEAKRQILEKEGKLPKAIIACGSGGSNALGIYQAFLKDKNVDLIFVEGEESAAFKYGSTGIFQGTKTYVLQDKFGMDRRTSSRAAGLNYPGRSPILSDLFDKRRMSVSVATDQQVLDAYFQMSRLEGLIPALETCHAIVELFRQKDKYKKDDVLILNFSGRGDKDIETVIKLKER